MNQHDYITLRIINTCLRENVSGVLTQGDVRQEHGGYWLYNSHLNHPLRIEVEASDYMQSWVAIAPRWQIQQGDSWHSQEGHQPWLALLMPDSQQETLQLYANYKEEADAACEQGELCQDAFVQLSESLARLPENMSWGERLLHADQIASYLDHPYYPTARAKFGFDVAQLRQYAPEFCQPFALRWLAVPKTALTLTRPPSRPAWWPSYTQVGLDEWLSQSHELIPVHPLTWSQLSTLPEGAIAAPQAWLDVRPTLSVRTVQLENDPATHLKIPLAMRTLGQKNIRLIKPSTLYDGQWFAEILPALAQDDPLLQGRYRHVDESFCGHLGEEKLFAFLVRPLRWLAVPKTALTLTRPPSRPAWWPSYTQVGLDEWLSQSHELIPVHPLTWSQLSTLPEGAIAAPQAWLDVRPTLSVRTVQLENDPATHLKIPLAMRTLGQKNIRLIKPSTLYDGQWFAEILPALAQDDPLLQGRYRHVDESFCGHLGEEKLFAFLVRRYPAPQEKETLAPVAALGGSLPDGKSYLDYMLAQPGMPDIVSWWQEYCQLMADVHLTLWLRYGIALESNQQNAILSFIPGKPLSLMMKDNDAARLWAPRFTAARPDLAHHLNALRDERICVEDELALAQMFITITLQLDLAAVLENLAARGALPRQQGYQILRDALLRTIEQLEHAGCDTALARQVLFAEEYQPVKYLLLSGSLLSKQASGAADINKYYGQSGPNFLKGSA